MRLHTRTLQGFPRAAAGRRRGGNMNLYGRLVGSRCQRSSSRWLNAAAVGRMAFRRGSRGRAIQLEGRAMPDVWIVPSRGAPAGRGTRRATSMCRQQPCAPMTPEIGAWRRPWTDLVTQSSFRMIGRRQGCDIVQLGKTESGRLLRSSSSHSRPPLSTGGASLSPTLGRFGPPMRISAPGALPWSREGLGWKPRASFPKPRETAGPGLS